MKPGKELDALIAEKVTGWKPSGLLGKDHKYAVKEFYEPPHYSTDIAAAWEVVDKIAPLDDFRLAFRNGEWFAEFSSMINQFAQAGTAPHAICLAALKAVSPLNGDEK